MRCVGDDGILTFDEKLWIFGKFYAKCDARVEPIGHFQPCMTEIHLHI